KGYFNNEVSYEIDSTDHKEKRAVVNYNLATGPAYFLDSITTHFESKDLDSIYNRYKRFSRIRPGQQFDFIYFDAEKERLHNIFVNSGIYKFQPSSISFDIQRDTTSASEDRKMPVVISIQNAQATQGGPEVPYKIHHVKEVNIYADYSFNNSQDSLSSITHDGYTIY